MPVIIMLIIAMLARSSFALQKLFGIRALEVMQID